MSKSSKPSRQWQVSAVDRRTIEVIGLDIHIPFCTAKSSYCDFDSYAGLEGLFDDYATALAREIKQAGPTEVHTIYIGGGTPSVLPLSHLAFTLSTVRETFALKTGAEITIETNPGTADAQILAELRGLGVNRLSLGVQSFDGHEPFRRT